MAAQDRISFVIIGSVSFLRQQSQGTDLTEMKNKQNFENKYPSTEIVTEIALLM